MPAPNSADLYCARVDSSNAGGVHGLADEHEDIKVVVLSFAEAMSLARGDKIKNGLTVLALYWLALERDRLRGEWR